MILSPRKLNFSLLIVDDHELTRISLKLLFASQKHINLVGIATNGLEAINLVELHFPDVIILDLQMPLMNGLTAAQNIKKISPHTQIIAHSSILEIGEKVNSQSLFIDYFCPKNIDNTTLIQLVNELGIHQVKSHALGVNCS
jgi:two-component system, NarL family, vancomycin resistance associated response regulator VraR